MLSEEFMPTLTPFGLFSNFLVPLTFYVCLWRLACIRFEIMVRNEIGDPEEAKALLRIMHPAQLGREKQ